ncbi:MAG: hydrolase family protein [Pseudonocardiales bacterium]|nr:hydrolase family protein [Pseudonocardiales bacterium]
MDSTRSVWRRTLGAAGIFLLIVTATAVVWPSVDRAPGLRAVTTTPGAPATISKVASHRLLVVGASYTQGLGALPQTNGYAYLVGQLLDWPTTVAGASGTGFINPGIQHQGTYGQRIAKIPPLPAPGLVIVQCGRNDIGYPPQEEHVAVVRTIAEIRTRFPHAQVVFLGSIPGVAPPTPGIHAIENLLREQAAVAGVPFIDPVREGWITKGDGPRYTGLVANHPNNAGYAFIARRVVQDLQRLSQGRIVAKTSI